MSKHGKGICPVCGQQASDNLLCTPCTTSLLTDLADLPGLMRDLMIAYRKGKTFDLVGLDSRPANAELEESSLPFSPYHRRVHDRIRDTVGVWIRTLADDNHADIRHLQPTMPAWCDWLCVHAAWIRVHPAVVQINADINGAAHRAREAVDLPPDLTFVTRCPTCDRNVYARPDDEHAVCIHCRRAGVTPLTRYNVAAVRSDQLRRLEHQWLTVPGCVHWLGEFGLPVKDQQIYHWTQKERGIRLHPRGVNEQGQKLYRLGDVADLAREVLDRKARA